MTMHYYQVLCRPGGAGVRAGGHLPAGEAAARRRQGARHLLHPALHRPLQEGGPSPLPIYNFTYYLQYLHYLEYLQYLQYLQYLHYQEYLSNIYVSTGGPAHGQLRRAAPGDPEQGQRDGHRGRRHLLPGV